MQALDNLVRAIGRQRSADVVLVVVSNAIVLAEAIRVVTQTSH